MFSPTQPLRPASDPNVTLAQVESMRVKAPSEAARELGKEGVSLPTPVRRGRTWSRRSKLGLAITALAVAAVVLVAVVVSSAPPIPTSLPISAGTVFSLLPMAGLPAGSPDTYIRTFSGSSNGSVFAPPGMCLQLVGAWKATAPTYVLGIPPDLAGGPVGEMNGTINTTMASWIGFGSHQPDTITVTQTIQWVVISCP